MNVEMQKKSVHKSGENSVVKNRGEPPGRLEVRVNWFLNRKYFVEAHETFLLQFYWAI